MTVAASFNGGRSQTGLNFLQIGGEYAFLNVLKTAGNWGYSLDPHKDAFLDPALFDANGYPMSIQTGGYYTVCYVPASWVGQSLTLQWDGGGTVRVPGTLLAGSATSIDGSTNNSLTLTCVNQAVLPGVTSSSVSPNHIQNIRLSLTGAETTLLNAGEVFRPQFKNKLLEAGFGVLRFMDWHSNNITNATDWASRKPLTYFSYQASEFRNSASSGRPALYCGNTTNSGNAYSITGNGTGVPATGAPAHMQRIQLHFNADSSLTGTCSLNLNGSGAKNILSWWGNALSTGENSYPQADVGSPTANPSYANLVFDTELNAWLLMGGNIAYNSSGIVAGVPPELCLQLAAEIGAHPYFNMPRFAVDAGTDYITGLAAYCQANAPSWMIPRFEGPNETFNTGNGAFHNGVYGRNKANTLWGFNDQFRRYGYWMSILGQGIAATYGVTQANTKTQNLYQVLCGVQTSAGSSSTFDEELSSATYISVGVAPSGYSKTAGVAEAWRWVTHVAIAQYFTPSDFTSPEETAAVAAYQIADAPTKASLIYNYIMSCNRSNVGGVPFNVAFVTAQFAMWKTWAKSFSVNKMCGYEGGYSPDYTGGGSSNADKFRNDGKGVYELSGMLAAVFQGFVGQSDSTFTAEFPSTFYMTDFTVDVVTTYVWTLLKGDIESANTPQFDFIVRFNKGRRAISPRLPIHS